MKPIGKIVEFRSSATGNAFCLGIGDPTAEVACPPSAQPCSEQEARERQQIKMTVYTLVKHDADGEIRSYFGILGHLDDEMALVECTEPGCMKVGQGLVPLRDPPSVHRCWTCSMEHLKRQHPAPHR